jgi:AcrR family transcriptional regulator
LRRRRRDPQDKRARILDAARRFFAVRGTDATMGEIARAAGVSHGILFHHFGSKEELLVAVAHEYGAGLAGAMFAAPGGDGAPTARSMLRAAFAYVREQGSLVGLLAVVPGVAEREKARLATRTEIVDALTAALTRWNASKRVRSMEPRIVAELLHSLVERALVECFLVGDGSREEEYLRETIRCVEGATFPR